MLIRTIFINNDIIEVITTFKFFLPSLYSFKHIYSKVVSSVFSHQNYLRALTVLSSSESEECSNVVGSDLFSVTPPPEDQTTVRVSGLSVAYTITAS